MTSIVKPSISSMVARASAFLDINDGVQADEALTQGIKETFAVAALTINTAVENAKTLWAKVNSAEQVEVWQEAVAPEFIEALTLVQSALPLIDADNKSYVRAINAIFLSENAGTGRGVDPHWSLPLFRGTRFGQDEAFQPPRLDVPNSYVCPGEVPPNYVLV